MNILVVDDDATQRKLLRVTLEAQGQTITEAGDGVAALEMLERGATDAIISDGLMPRMDGYRLCYEVRRKERFRNLPFIIYTSTFTTPSDGKFAVGVGGSFVRKPASATELLALLNESKARRDFLPGTEVQELAVLQEYSARLVAELEQKHADLIRTTEELRKARDFYLTLLDDFPTPVWRSGLDAKRNYLNRAWLQFTGRKPEQDLGEGYIQVLHPDDVARVMREYLAAFHARQPFSVQFRLRRFDGVYRNFLSYGRPYIGLDGNFAGYVGSCYDITESKCLQDRLANFASLGQKLNSATTIREAAKIISDVTDHLFGWDAFAFDLYSTVSGLMQPVLRIDLIEGQRTEVSRDATPEQPTARARRVLRDGGQIILREVPAFEPGAVPFGDTARPSASIITVPLRDAAQVVGTLSIHSYSRNAYDRQALDTMQALADYCGGALDRIRAAVELFESEERFRQLAVNIHKVFWLTDLHNTEMFYVNPAYQKIWGRTRQSLYAAPSSWLQAVHPEDQARVREAFKKRKESDTLDLTYRIVRPDGEVRWIHDHVFPVPNEQGEFYRRAGLAQDITEQRHAEDDLRLSQAQLRALAARLQAALEAQSARTAREIHDVLGQQGFDEKKLFDRNSLGLLGMRERAAFIGASLKTSSAPGKGTTVTVALPLPATNTQSKGIASQRKAQHENSHRR